MPQSASPFFSVNFHAVEKLHPHLYLILSDASNINRTEIKSDIPNSPISEIKDAYEILSFSSMRKPKILIVLGISTPSFLFQLYQQHSPHWHRLILIEPDILHFIDLLSQTDFSSLFEDHRVIWSLDAKGIQLADILNQIYTALGSWGMDIYIAPSTKQKYPDKVEFLLKACCNTLESAQLNTQTQIERSGLIQINILRNLPRIMRAIPVSRLENASTGIPAIVVGAGPSLNKTIDSLKNLPPSFLLIAVDTALPVLLKQDIHPHIVAACDPTPLNLKHFIGIPALGETIFAFLPETYYKILEQYPHHSRLICLQDWESKTLQYLVGELGIKKIYRRGTNVGYCAFSLARLLGCTPIILVGIDLAISSERRSHAEGTRNVSDIQIHSDKPTARFCGNVESSEIPIRIVEGYGGEPVFTFPYFYQSLLWFERDIAEMKAPVIDAAEGGAKKRGAIPMPLFEAIKTYSAKINVTERLEKTISFIDFTATPSTIPRLQELKKGLHNSAHQLERGIAQLNAWIEFVRSGECPDEDIAATANQFFQRWNDVLYSPMLDIGMDIALARLRHETRCDEIPDSLSGKSAAEWWYVTLARWFEDLQKDLVTFEQIYEYTLQEVNQLK